MALPKFTLGFFPTPVHRLDRLSDQLGINLYLKRDDLTGPNLFGGNKIRKLEYLLGDAIQQGADTLITFGATQSNHAMETAVAARKAGLDVILYLETITQNDEADDRANILIDKVLGAKIHCISMDGRTEAEADELAMQQAKQKAHELAQQGHKAYIIPVGGATPIGSASFVTGFKELKDQLSDVQIDYVVHGSGTGGTAAGLVAGAKAYADDEGATKVLSINVSPKPVEHYQHVVDLGNEALSLLELDARITVDDTHFNQAYFGEGYEIPSDAGTNAIKRLAMT
jgi:D-cysteine desulfhydrase/L-cysteate sulfo-lyase